MKIERFQTQYMQSYTYCIIENRHGIIIDPCEMDEIKQITLQDKVCIDYAILTHEHYDHISGLDWVQSLHIPVIASRKCNKNLDSPKMNQSRYYDAFCKLQEKWQNEGMPCVQEYRGHADILFEKEHMFCWQGHEFLLMETPGHSEGSVCILLDQKYLFSGDTLFGSCETNTRLTGGDLKSLVDITMPWIQSLNPETVVYPGHYQVFKLTEKNI